MASLVTRPGKLRSAGERGPRPHRDAGAQVLVRNLVVATGAEGHWLLEGEWWQRAVPVSVDDLGRRVAGLLRLPGSMVGR
jgi:hypothetical protein